MDPKLADHNYGIIMAGGLGSRFWPLSTRDKPKQFHDFLESGKTLLQQTYQRMQKLITNDHIYLVINENYRTIVLEQLPELSEGQLISEPSAKNTAPCIAYASYKLFAKDPQANLLVTPSDHLIKFEDEFIRIAHLALEETKRYPHIITLGIQPHTPETGFGYIKYASSNSYIKKVMTFTEKPVAKLAKEFIRSGDYLWNAGIFIFSAQTIIAEFEKLTPDLHHFFSQALPLYNTSAEKTYIEVHYPTLSSDSIDYAIMEKSSCVYVIPSSFGWSDLGTWSAMYDQMEKDSQGNAVVGRVILDERTKNSLIISDKDKVVVVDNLKDYFVIDTKKVLLICPKDKAQEIKNYVQLVANDYDESFT